jgi:hypothetical protein
MYHIVTKWLRRSGRFTKLFLLLHTFGKPGAYHQRQSRCRLEPVLARNFLDDLHSLFAMIYQVRTLIIDL